MLDNQISMDLSDEEPNASCGAIEGQLARTGRKTRIAVLNSHPIQYFAPLYAYLNRASDLEITALYLSDVSVRGGRDKGFNRDVKWDVDLLSGYRSVFLGPAAQIREPGKFWSLIAPQVIRELRSGRYDVLWLHGHQHAANVLALVAAKIAGIPVMMRGETHLGLPRRGLKSMLRRPLMRAFYGCCDRLLTIGSANAAFYRSLAVPDHKLFLVPYAVDNARFMEAAELTAEQKATIRQKYKIALDRPAVLYAAKFTLRKRPNDLLQAAMRLNQESAAPFTLVMAGSGELEPELRAFCTEYRIRNAVFTGFINQSELPRLYAACDVFVLPSQDEPWGLAVNEAMCARLPIVVSREVGCVPDLVADGINGFTLHAGDTDALTRAIRCLIEDPRLRLRQGEASFARIEHWDFEQCLKGVRAAIADLE
jgi:glycosyltransferase involved in cell wall biosynthesis